MAGRILFFLVSLLLASCKNGSLKPDGVDADNTMLNDSLVQTDTLPISRGAIISDSTGHGHSFLDTVSVRDSIRSPQDEQPLDPQRKRMLDNILKEKMRIDISDTTNSNPN